MPRGEKVGRNDPCPCGSGRKFKRCCEAKLQQNRGRVMLAVVVGVAVFAILVGIVSFSGESRQAGPTQVWSTEHGHYHTIP